MTGSVLNTQPLKAESRIRDNIELSLLHGIPTGPKHSRGGLLRTRNTNPFANSEHGSVFVAHCDFIST
jgi:hypothetical protein